MDFNEQINLLLSLSKLHSTELDTIEYTKEQSELVLREIEECFEIMKNMLPTLQYIRSLLMSLLKKLTDIKMPFISQCLEKRNHVEGNIFEESRIIKEYQEILAQLESVKIDNRLIEHLYKESRFINPTYTLRDWVNTSKFESIENLVCSITKESQEQIEFLKKEKNRLDSEYFKISSQFNKLDEQFRVAECGLNNEKFMEEVMNTKKTIDNIYTESITFFHILSKTIDYARKNNTIQDLSNINERSKTVKSKASNIDDYLLSLRSKLQDLKKSSESLYKLYADYKELHTKLGKFSKDVNSLISQLDTIDDFEYKPYKDLSPMKEIQRFINNCKNFMKDYNEVVNEINRRSEIHKQNEEITLIIQNELDLLVAREKKERMNFEDRFSTSKEALPEVWKYAQLFKCEPEIVYKIIRK